MTSICISVNQPYYHPGDIIQGVVHVECPKRQKVRSIVLEAVGYERTRIVESHGVGKHRHTHTYISQNSMHQFAVTLLGECELEPGAYDYPFEYVLPQQLLPTYHGFDAVVAYTVTANVDIPMWFDANQTIETIVVIPRCDVTLQKVPASFATPTANDPTKPGFMVTLARTMFLAGERIKGNFMVTGNGGKTIRKADVTIQLVENAVAQGHSRVNYGTLGHGQIAGEYLIPGQTVPFELVIPPTISTAYNGVYSRVSFMLAINLDVAWAFDTSAAQPLVIVNTQ
jgi:hypothetical protein